MWKEAMQATGLTTKRAAVQAGLRLLVQIKAQTAIRRLRDTIVWEGDLDEVRSEAC